MTKQAREKVKAAMLGMNVMRQRHQIRRQPLLGIAVLLEVPILLNNIKEFLERAKTEERLIKEY